MIQLAVVLLLKYDNGYSTAEIASMLGLTEENVKKRLQRARKKLQEILIITTKLLVWGQCTSPILPIWFRIRMNAW